MMQPPKNEKIRFLRFITIGVLNTLIDFILMNIFTQFFKIPLVIAQALSFSIAVACSYLFNRIWIYPEAIAGSVSTQFPKFVVINLFGLAVRSWLVPLFDGLIASWLRANSLQIKGLSLSFLSHNSALAFVLPLTILMNFFLNRAWTFKVERRKSL